MTEQKKKMSKLCLAGFLMSVLMPVLLVLNFALSRMLYGLYDEYVVYAVILFMPLIGLILSIVGLITAIVKRRKGKGFGIAGIVVPNLYAAAVVIMAVSSVFIAIDGNRKTVEMQKQREVYLMGAVGKPVNDEYDVSRYRIPKGTDLTALHVYTNESDLKTYAESKLQSINLSGNLSIRGKYQDKDFLIIRSDFFEEWLSNNSLGIGSVNFNDGYASISYDFSWEFMGIGFRTLAMYKDPSGKFIIITNCSDYKVITEFFEG